MGGGSSSSHCELLFLCVCVYVCMCVWYGKRIKREGQLTSVWTIYQMRQRGKEREVTSR